MSKSSVLKKCSPEDMQANLSMVTVLTEMGINFVPMPVRDAAHREQLMQEGQEVLEELLAVVRFANQPASEVKS